MLMYMLISKIYDPVNFRPPKQGVKHAAELKFLTYSCSIYTSPYFKLLISTIEP